MVRLSLAEVVMCLSAGAAKLAGSVSPSDDRDAAGGVSGFGIVAIRRSVSIIVISLIAMGGSSDVW